MRNPPVLIALLYLLPGIVAGGPIERGRQTLHDALRTSLAPMREPAPVLLVLDATPYTRAGAKWIEQALLRLDRAETGPWSAARLGEAPLPTQTTAAALAPLVQQLVARPQRHTSTLRALRRSLKGWPRSGGMVVYLADWHFEDDEQLEALVSLLRDRRQTLSVVGSEAAFARGWNDGFDRFGKPTDIDRIGRNAFHTEKAGVPWHGGETAYPHLPQHFGGMAWRTEFGHSLGFSGLFAPREEQRSDLPEDVRERLEELNAERKKRIITVYPLPSAFGPYGLMRLAAETGGRYVLWSWNPTGRASVRYDYTRCNLFAPDLRSRNAIRADISRRPLARALLSAWHAIANRRTGIARTTPPIARDFVTSKALTETPNAEPLPTLWRTKHDRDRYVKIANRTIRAVDKGVRALDRGIAGTARPPDPVDRRYFADARLFRHILLVQRFTLGEGVAVATSVGDDAWEDKKSSPALRHREWIPETPRDEDPRALHDRIRDHARGAALLSERTDYLRQFRGTPFGEQVRRNPVHTYVLTRFGKGDGKGMPPKTGPAFSDLDPTPTPDRDASPGTGSGGSGPTSGG